MTRAYRYHAIERTSPKGGPFFGTCRLCGVQNLSPADGLRRDCPNQRGLSAEEALLESIDPPDRVDASVSGSDEWDDKPLGPWTGGYTP